MKPKTLAIWACVAVAVVGMLLFVLKRRVEHWSPSAKYKDVKVIYINNGTSADLSYKAFKAAADSLKVPFIAALDSGDKNEKAMYGTYLSGAQAYFSGKHSTNVSIDKFRFPFIIVATGDITNYATTAIYGKHYKHYNGCLQRAHTYKYDWSTKDVKSWLSDIVNSFQNGTFSSYTCQQQS